MSPSNSKSLVSLIGSTASSNSTATAIFTLDSTQSATATSTVVAVEKISDSPTFTMIASATVSIANMASYSSTSSSIQSQSVATTTASTIASPISSTLATDGGVTVSFSETLSAPLTQVYSFTLPSGSNDLTVIAAVQKTVLEAATEASTINGVLPSNITAVTSVQVSAVDGSVIITVRIFESFSTSINSTTHIPTSVYSADPVRSTAAAVTAASNGIAVKTAAASLAATSHIAAGNAAALVNGTLLTGTPPTELALRVSSAAIAALLSIGNSKNAALINATSLAVIGEGSSDPIISSTSLGIASSSGILSSTAAVTELLKDSFFTNSMIGAVIFAFAIALFVFVCKRHRSSKKKTTKAPIPYQQLQLQPSPKLSPKSPRIISGVSSPSLLPHSPSSGRRLTSSLTVVPSLILNPLYHLSPPTSPSQKMSQSENITSTASATTTTTTTTTTTSTLSSRRLKEIEEKRVVIKASSPLRNSTSDGVGGGAATTDSQGTPFTVDNPLVAQSRKSSKSLREKR